MFSEFTYGTRRFQQTYDVIRAPANRRRLDYSARLLSVAAYVPAWKAWEYVWLNSENGARILKGSPAPSAYTIANHPLLEWLFET